MNYLKRSYFDILKYREFLYFSIRYELKNQLANTVLGYLWWLLDPLMLMMVYTIIFSFIFENSIENFPLFIFCALLPWKWMTATLSNSSNCIRARSSILQQIYIPKFTLPLIQVVVNFMKFAVGLIVLIPLILLFQVELSAHIFEILFIIAVNFMVIYGLSLILSHAGVFFKDLSNFLSHFIRIWFYLSPGLYAIERIPDTYRFLWWLNPNTTLFESYRNVLIYGQSPLYKELLIWALLSAILIWLGLRKLYVFDKNYVKMI